MGQDGERQNVPSHPVLKPVLMCACMKFFTSQGVKNVCSDNTVLALNVEGVLMIKTSLTVGDVVQIINMTDVAMR